MRRRFPLPRRQVRALPAYRRSAFGYVVVPLSPAPSLSCRAPVGPTGRLSITGLWITQCFLPAFRRSQLRWGHNAPAISAELMFELRPAASIGTPRLAAEQELRRRIDLAVAVLLNAGGFPTPYPSAPPLPRRVLARGTTPWVRALLTGWAS